MRLHFKDELYDAQLLRAVGHATYHGAELDECLATVAGLRVFAWLAGLGGALATPGG